MDVFVGVAVLVSFVAGVLFHKYVVSEAASIKSHVSAEVATLKSQIEYLKKI